MAQRKIDLGKFKRQLEEGVVGDDSLIEVAVSAERSVWIKVPVLLDESDTYLRDVQAISDAREGCIEILNHKPGATGEEQLAVLLEAYPDEDSAYKLIMAVWMTETSSAQERLGGFRYRG